MSRDRTRRVRIGTIAVGGGEPLVLFAGPCVVERRDLVLRTAEQVKQSAGRYGTPVVFKSSYKKANRTSAASFVGIGMDEALKILEEVKRLFDLPILTDIHAEPEVAAAAEVADVLQIPAFLCRQTELLQAAGRTGRVVNIKKGQFLAPEDMRYAAEKVEAVGNRNILFTERGTSFGYHNLVVDMRSLKIMADVGYPIVFDATHSVQLPSGDTRSAQTSGRSEFILPLARAAAAVGIDGVFVEVHPNPREALSDAASQLPLGQLDELLRQVTTIAELTKEWLHA
ncbi:MAG: 3-deoxy-8-phosphooctulonate synthase [Ignavibacteria bacterium]